MTSPVAGFVTGILVTLGASVTGLACIADASLSLPSFRPAREDVGVGSTVLLSDIHLASSGGIDLLRRPEFREKLWVALADADELILLGDVVELRDMPLASAVEIARPFFDELGAVVGDGRVVMVPGNHDHHLLDDWLERRRLDGATHLGLEQRIPIDAGPLAELTGGMGKTEVELAYPGVFLRPNVYATHGHYLDRHLTVPSFERLAVAAVERVLTGSRDPSDDDLPAHGDPGSESPDDYERIQAPLYAFLFTLAQSGGSPKERLGGANPSARVWQAVGGGYGRAARIRGRLLGSVAVPGAVGVANRLGLGPVKSDLSPGAITRAGLAAMGEVVRRLGIEADHVIFGHTHRRGPLRAEVGWRLEDGTRLHNTGSWVHSAGLIGRSAADSPYWPGTIVVVEGDREPRSINLLEDLGKEELRGGY
jgi:predicted phosphodiesterase